MTVKIAEYDLFALQSNI